MAVVNVPYARSSFTAQGSVDGIVTVGDNSAYIPQAWVTVASVTQPTKTYRIYRLIGGTQVQLRRAYFLEPDLSAYQVYDYAYVVQNQQVINNNPPAPPPVVSSGNNYFNQYMPGGW